MSIQALNWAFALSDVPMAEKFTLVVLANYADDKHSCFPSQRRIADDMGSSVTTVRRSLKALEDRGLVSRQKRGKEGGGRTSDRYVLSVGAPPLPVNVITKGGVTGQIDRFKPVDLEGVTGQIDRGTTTEPPEEPLGAASVAAPTAQTLIAEWIDHCHAPPPGRVRGHVAKELKTLLEEGHPYERVRDALAEWNSRGLHPSVLPSVLHELNVKHTPSRPRITGRMEF